MSTQPKPFVPETQGHYAIYRKSDGLILASVFVSDSANIHDAMIPDGCAVLSCAEHEPHSHYVRLSDMTVQERADLPAFDKLTVRADGIDAARVSGLPNPTRVVVRGGEQEEFDVTDGELVLRFVVPGVYHLRIDGGARFRFHKFDITAT